LEEEKLKESLLSVSILGELKLNEEIDVEEPL